MSCCDRVARITFKVIRLHLSSIYNSEKQDHHFVCQHIYGPTSMLNCGVYIEREIDVVCTVDPN